jgi:acetyl-CoA decarbonylase/synthase complex subunit delta
MVVNREYQGETPVGMTFSSLAGNVGGGQQTPGFMGCGKVFLTSRKFLYAEGGFKRLVWMPKQLKEQLANDLNKRFEEQDVPGLLDLIADESVAVEASDVRKYMEKVKHPALEMTDMSVIVQQERLDVPDSKNITVVEDQEAVVQKQNTEDVKVFSDVSILQLKEEIKKEMVLELRNAITREVVHNIISTLNQNFLGIQEPVAKEAAKSAPDPGAGQNLAPKAKEKVGAIKSFAIRKEKCQNPVWQVKLGALKSEGGSRGKTYTVGGASCMPFHLWEGEMPNRPLIAMEVFDVVSEKYPAILRRYYGDLLGNPALMAKECVEKYGADLISVRLDGTHPERGNRTAAQAVELVKSILQAVDVPLIVTGHNSFDKNNEVMKAVAQACAGENLLLNWVEQNNYRTIAGAALAYGHTVVAQSPIDVNISKQMNILLTNMDIKKEQIILDPLTGATGYGIEYTYSVMERIRITGLGGDAMLAGPMIVSPGQECAKIKEFKAEEADLPLWGDLAKRAVNWELSTAISMLYAGADVLIMYHPEAAMAARKAIFDLMDGSSNN